jgi:hypothetical protein
MHGTLTILILGTVQMKEIDSVLPSDLQLVLLWEVAEEPVLGVDKDG